MRPPEKVGVRTVTNQKWITHPIFNNSERYEQHDRQNQAEYDAELSNE